MKARLVKADLSVPKVKIKSPADNRQMNDTVWSWVHQFRVASQDRSRSEFQRLKYPEKA